ncbi:MAG: queuosine precursor transporter [Candidatus Tectomicrobia bacterium]|nr:queuosine precursor transporter [Candidatus Tectomicrobia bacterium]
MNEILFFALTLIGLGASLIAFRAGKVWLTALVGVNIVLANIFVTKQIDIFGLQGTGGIVLYAAIFLSTDLLCEHYGEEEARDAVYVGFFCALLFLLTSQVLLLFTPAPRDQAHPAMQVLFGAQPRIIGASLLAYLVSQLHDVWSFGLLRRLTQGRHPWLRNNGSTWVSQAIDTVLFNGLAFAGVFPARVVVQIIISSYILKIIVAIIDTPFFYAGFWLHPATDRSKAR